MGTLRTRRHEASHAAVAHALGWRVGRIRLRADGSGSCVTIAPPIPEFRPHPTVHHHQQWPVLLSAYQQHNTTQQALENVVIGLAGIEAERQFYGSARESRARGDRREVRRTIREQFGRGVQRWHRAEQLTADLVAANRAAINHLAHELRRWHEMPGREVRRVLNLFRDPVELSDDRAARLIERRERRVRIDPDSLEPIRDEQPVAYEWRGGGESPIRPELAFRARLAWADMADARDAAAGIELSDGRAGDGPDELDRLIDQDLAWDEHQGYC